MSAFRVGQELVCIQTKWPLAWLWGEGPKKGEICVIASMEPHPKSPNVIGLCLEGYPDDLFNSAYFRPLVTRKTDISIFTALLNTKSEKELV